MMASMPSASICLISFVVAYTKSSNDTPFSPTIIPLLHTIAPSSLHDPMHDQHAPTLHSMDGTVGGTCTVTGRFCKEQERYETTCVARFEALASTLWLCADLQYSFDAYAVIILQLTHNTDATLRKVCTVQLERRRRASRGDKTKNHITTPRARAPKIIHNH